MKTVFEIGRETSEDGLCPPSAIMQLNQLDPASCLAGIMQGSLPSRRVREEARPIIRDFPHNERTWKICKLIVFCGLWRCDTSAAGYHAIKFGPLLDRCV